MTRQEKAARNQADSLAAFLAAKARFDAQLADLRQMSGDHFGADPDAVLWGHAADLNRWSDRLCEVTDCYFRRGEFAA